MGTNTDGILQVYSTVPSGDNAGKPSIEDALELDVKLKRDIATLSTTASAINTDLGVLDVSSAKIIEIEMDANITDFNLTGLDSLQDQLLNPVNANGLATLIKFKQAGAGNFTVAVDVAGDIDFNTNVSSFNLSGSVGRVDSSVLIFDKSTAKYFVNGFQKGNNQ